MSAFDHPQASAASAAEVVSPGFAGDAVTRVPSVPPVFAQAAVVRPPSVPVVDHPRLGAELSLVLAADVEAPRSSESADLAIAFDAERMVAYHVALQLQCHASTLVPSLNRVLRDQFERASLSVVLNVAEGAGRHSLRQKRYHYGVARGSAMECAAMCDVLRARRLAPDGETRRARSLAVRCVQLLSKLELALAKRSGASQEAVA